MKIAVMGTGALGALFAGYLARAGEEVWAVDIKPEIVETIRAAGVRIREASGEENSIPLRATRTPEEIGQAELVIFLPKSRQTQPAAEDARPLFGPKTVGLTLQNGLGNPEVLESILGEGRILAGVTSHGSTLISPGKILHAGSGDTIIGEMRGGFSERAEEITGLLNRAGIVTRVSGEIRNEVWGKLIVNIGINALSAITRLRNGDLLQYPETRETLRRAVLEAKEIADRKGIRLPFPNPVEKTEEACRLTRHNYSSMLQDVLSQRETEVDFINGAVVCEGAGLGRETPINWMLMSLVKALEKTYSLHLG
jgi:2-dehydropantoate 2-reductase